MSRTTDYQLAGPIRKTCDLFRLLAGHEVLGLAPGEIAKGLGVPPSWVSQNLPALATTGYVEQVAGTNRWRLGGGAKEGFFHGDTRCGFGGKLRLQIVQEKT